MRREILDMRYFEIIDVILYPIPMIDCGSHVSSLTSQILNYVLACKI